MSEANTAPPCAAADCMIPCTVRRRSVARHRHVHLDRDVATEGREVGAGEVGAAELPGARFGRLSRVGRCGSVAVRAGQALVADVGRSPRVGRSRRRSTSRRSSSPAQAVNATAMTVPSAIARTPAGATVDARGDQVTDSMDVSVCDWSPHGTSTCREPHRFPCNTRFADAPPTRHPRRVRRIEDSRSATHRSRSPSGSSSRIGRAGSAATSCGGTPRR